MSTVAVSPDTRKLDVLTITLFLAALAHALLILGLGFQPFLQEMRTPPALEVILVQQTNDSEAPEEADYLAQSAQDGGGQSDDNARPASPFASQQDLDTDGLAATPVQASSPEPAKPGAEPVLTTVFSQDEVKTDESEQETSKDIARKDTILIEENLDIARLAAEIERQQEKFAKRPKKKWLNARTHEATSAEYMYRWVEKVERIGNLNYPDEVRRKKLTGALMLSVGIYKNGDIESITVEESSGHRLLDDSARRIVELSGPFAPLTGSLAEDTDILYIVRTWEFNSSNSVISY